MKRRNIKKLLILNFPYLLAALFNAVSTMDNHYAMLVNHDFYGDSP